MNRRKVLLLLAILLLAISLRLAGISGREIEYDDAFSIFLSARGLAQIVQGTAADTMPPLYYFLLHFWQGLGSSLAFLRLSGVILSMGILLISFDLVRRAWGWSSALWTALLIAIAPIQIYHAQDLRMYTLLVLGQIGYFWCFFRIFLEKDTLDKRLGLWVGLVLFGLVAMYSHNLAVFGLAIADLFLATRRKWRHLLYLVLAQAVIGLLSLPWLVMVPGQVAKIQTAFWTPRPGLVEIFQALIQFSANLPLSGAVLVLAAIFSLQILVLVAIESWKRRKSDPLTGFFAWIALGLPVILFAVSYIIRPVFVARGFLVSSIGYYALIGRVLDKKWLSGIGPFVAIAFIISVAVSLPSLYTFNDFPRSPYRQMVAYLETVTGDQDLVVHENKLSFFPSYFYDRQMPQVFLADEPGSANDTYAPGSQQAIGLIPVTDIQAATQGQDNIYFVAFSQAIQEYQDSLPGGDPNLTWLKSHYTLVDQQTFNDLDVFHFARQP